jgi:hypothetical protein
VPPEEVPPEEVPPEEVPPEEVPPEEVPASPPLALGDASSDEHPHDEARMSEEIRVGKTDEFIVGVPDTVERPPSAKERLGGLLIARTVVHCRRTHLQPTRVTRSTPSRHRGGCRRLELTRGTPAELAR